MSIKVSMWELADLSIGAPEAGVVNFNALHTLLRAMIKHLKLEDMQTDLKEEGRPPPKPGESLSRVSLEKVREAEDFREKERREKRERERQERAERAERDKAERDKAERAKAEREREEMVPGEKEKREKEKVEKRAKEKVEKGEKGEKEKEKGEMEKPEKEKKEKKVWREEEEEDRGSPQLSDLEKRIEELESSLRGVEDNVMDVEDQVRDMKFHVRGVKDQVHGMQDHLQEVEDKMAGVGKKVNVFEKQVAVLEKLPSGTDLLEKSRSGTGAVADMWQMMQMQKKVEANEEGINQAMALLQDLVDEASVMKSATNDLQEEMQKLKEHVALIDPHTFDDKLKTCLSEQMMLDQDVKGLEQKLSRYPSPEEMDNMVRWEVLEDVLVKRKGSSSPEISPTGSSSPQDRRTPGPPGTQPTVSRGIQASVSGAQAGAPEAQRGAQAPAGIPGAQPAAQPGAQPGYPEARAVQPGYSAAQPGAPGVQGPYPAAPGVQGPYPAAPGVQGAYPPAPGVQGPYPPAPGAQGPYPGAAGAQGPYPGAPGAQGPYPGAPGVQGPYPGAPRAQGPYPGAPGVQGPYPGAAGAQAAYPGMPGPQGPYAGVPGAQPGVSGAQPGAPGAQPGAPSVQPSIPGAQPGAPMVQADIIGALIPDGRTGYPELQPWVPWPLPPEYQYVPSATQLTMPPGSQLTVPTGTLGATPPTSPLLTPTTPLQDSESTGSTLAPARYAETVDALRQLAMLTDLYNTLKEQIGLLDHYKCNHADLNRLRDFLTDAIYRSLAIIPPDLTEKLAAMKSMEEDLKAEKDKDEEMLSNIQNTILQVQEDCEKLNSTTGNLLNDHRKKQQEISTLFKSLEKLESEKADKERVVMEVGGKADKAALAAKVSRTQFDATTEQLHKMMQELLNKMAGQEQDWQKMLDKLLIEMDSKLDRLELDPFREQLEERWKDIRKQLKEKPPPQDMGDDAAGLRRRLLAHFHCISCDRPLEVVLPGPQISSLPAVPGLPPHPSLRPYMVYEMEQMRQLSRNLKLGPGFRFDALEKSASLNKLRRIHSKMLMDIQKVQRHYGNAAKVNAQMIRELLQSQCIGTSPYIKREKLPDAADCTYLSVPRHCGGSHTLTYPYRRYGRLQQFPQFMPPEENTMVAMMRHEEVDILGLDGHIYKGRMDTQLPSITEKDGSRSRSKVIRSSSQRHQPTVTELPNLPARPHTAKVSIRSTSAKSAGDRSVVSQPHLRGIEEPQMLDRETLEIRMDIPTRHHSDEQSA